MSRHYDQPNLCESAYQAMAERAWRNHMAVPRGVEAPPPSLEQFQQWTSVFHIGNALKVQWTAAAAMVADARKAGNMERRKRGKRIQWRWTGRMGNE